MHKTKQDNIIGIIGVLCYLAAIIIVSHPALADGFGKKCVINNRVEQCVWWQWDAAQQVAIIKNRSKPATQTTEHQLEQLIARLSQQQKQNNNK